MIPKNATSLGPLGCCVRRAASSPRAWRGLTTALRSTVADATGAPFQRADRVRSSVDCSELARIVQGVGENSPVPPRGTCCGLLAVHVGGRGVQYPARIGSDGQW